MDKQNTILLTGAAGFIGSCLLGYLNQQGYNNIIIADDFNVEDKWFNFDYKTISANDPTAGIRMPYGASQPNCIGVAGWNSGRIQTYWMMIIH